MGGTSTSHSALSRDGRKSSNAYDLRSWQGLTAVLRVAKEKLPPADHAAFRDLVLQYAQRGGDPEYKKQIDAVLAKLDTPELKKEELKPEPQVEVSKREVNAASTHTPLRGARPTPRFSVSAPSVRPEPAPAEPVEEERVILSASAPIPEPEPVVEEVPKPEEVIEERPRSIPIVEEAPSAPKSLEEHKARITEIKRLVNEQIGNPVALVGAHKERGKEYMQALLAALKATGGGGVGADAAMRRLEDTYSALLTDKPQPKGESLLPTPTPPPASVPSALAKPVPTPEPPRPPLPPVIPKPEPKPEPISVPEPPKPVPPPVPRPVPPSMPPKPVEPPTPKPEPTPVPRPVPPTQKPVEVPVMSEPVSVPASEPLKPIPSPVPKPVPPAPKPVPPAPQPAPKPPTFSPTAALAARMKELEVRAEEQKKSTPVPEPTPIPKPVPPAPKPVSPPVAVPKAPVPKPAAAPEPSAHASGFPETKYTQKSVGTVSAEALAASGLGGEIQEARQSQSELASPAITKALHDLLHEWSIFESSGFFGTGPSGPEHPLYIKIASLSMGEIITGRYEGADRHVNNVIHDYVNAWRHEQGVAYTPSETFEHYLRRVVQRIQKRQTAA